MAYQDDKTQLVINVMGKDLYNSTTKEPNQLYLIPDDSNINLTDIQTYCRLSLIFIDAITSDDTLLWQINGQPNEGVAQTESLLAPYYEEIIIPEINVGYKCYKGSTVTGSDGTIQTNDIFILQDRQITLDLNDAEGYALVAYQGGQTFPGIGPDNPLEELSLTSDESTCTFLMGSDVVAFIKVPV